MVELNANKNSRFFGFTLLELVVAIGLIAVLASISISFIDPLEIQRKARDTVRLRDLNTLKSSIVLALQGGGVFLNRCTPASPCGSLTISNQSDGSGYVDIDLSKYVTSLPRDPQHNKGTFQDSAGATVNAEYQIAQENGDFEIRSRLEAKNNLPNYTSDGGNNSGYLEVGTKLDIL